MPIYQLSADLSFPPPELAHESGILALGGDLSGERLLLAYQNGIFPWYEAGQPILWWSPDPRMVLYPEKLKVSKSMRQLLRKKRFRISFDQDFEAVIRNCRKIPRPGQESTWITPKMVAAYGALHRSGYAHSVEVWEGEVLVGGLYGISLGRCFFGESMFAKVANASKAGFIHLVQQVHSKGFHLIDCQVYTSHLESLGAEEIPRNLFMKQLAEGLKYPSLTGSWGQLLEEWPGNEEAKL